ncbi:MAG: M28 family peptidase [Novosphingobium sp.]
MNRHWGTMNRWWRALLCAALAALSPPLNAAPRDKALESQLMAHITTLASDDFDGREPGTDGEAKTLRYLGKQWFDLGLISGTNDPGHAWFVPVTLVAREPAGSVVQFSRKGRRLYVGQNEALMLTSGKRALVENAPLLFVGNGAAEAVRNELAGRVAVLLAGPHDDGTRQNALLKAGASAVLTVLDGDRNIAEVAARRRRSGYALASDSLGGDLEGFISAEAFTRLFPGNAQTFAAMKRDADTPGFAPRLLDVNATLEATTRETTIHTHNLIGRLEGRNPSAGAVLFMAHWDHFGRCAEPPAEHLICNGAIDNASGLASLTEVARRLSRVPQMERDIYFVATTSEELGLLGAQAFAEDPPIPLKQIVAAFNIDSNAIAPAGTPLTIVGQGMTPLDAQIAAVAKAQKRKLIDGAAATAYVRRQDGWALLQHDVPAVMVTSAYGDIARMERFFETDYHRPSDVAKPSIELGGAAEDVAFLVALGRWFADPKRVPFRAR